MEKLLHKHQLGVTLSGLLIWIVILVLGGIFAMRLIPPYIEDAQIKDMLNAIARDPEMQNAPAKSIRESFQKRASINDVTVIDENDIEISKDAGGLTLEASYKVVLPLAGNISLVLEFNPSSGAR